ncbi:MAG: hypothetical protein JOZ33_02730, partial [Acidobacteriaceae bacterium]|nr:hypothetical protein [Acidobacteriaceae bacterium]
MLSVLRISSAMATQRATASVSTTPVPGGRIPRDTAWDNTVPLLFTEGYRFITNRCHRLGSDVFATRVMLRPVVCMQGAEAAQQFYHPERFTRRGALPLFAFKLIQDLGSVMALDGQ